MIEASIIMPVYNSELYVEKAILSILNQTFENFELIIVNDGSSDNSGEICNRYSKIDNRVIYYEKKNGGICSARNFGLERARGKYIAFIDNDDEVMPTLLEDNLFLLKKYDAEIVKFQKTKRYLKDGKIKSEIKKDMEFDIKFLSFDELIDNFKYVLEYGGTIWNCIFKKEFLDMHNIIFNEDTKDIIEDHDFNYECYRYLNKVVLNSKSYYIWNVRIEHSTTGKFIYNRFNNMKLMAEKEYQILKMRKVFEKDQFYWTKIKQEYLINIILVMNYNNSGFNYVKVKEYLKDIKKLEVFKRKLSLKEYKYLFKETTFLRTLSVLLFDYDLINLLWILSIIKMKKEISNGSRRF